MQKATFILSISWIFVLFLCSCQSSKTVSVEFPDGSYKGEIDKNGAKEGNGFYFWHDGSTYEGSFSKDKRHGTGTFRWANGETYEGDYLEDERTGKGKYIWPDNSFYEGTFLRGARHGFGIFVSSDQTRYEGYWFNDKQHGQGKLILPDGSATIGFWENGEMKLNPAPLPPKASKPTIIKPSNDEFAPPIKTDQEYLLQNNGTSNTGSNDLIPPSENAKAGSDIQTTSTIESALDIPELPTEKSNEVTGKDKREIKQTIQEPTTSLLEQTPFENEVQTDPGVPATKESSVWSGTVEEVERDFKTELIDGIDTIFDQKSGQPFTGKLKILTNNGVLRGEVQLLNGKMHGDEIEFDEAGIEISRTKWIEGKTVE